LDSRRELDRLAAFRHAAQDREHSLAALLATYEKSDWSSWTNEAGDTLLSLAMRRNCHRCVNLIEGGLPDAAAAPVKDALFDAIDTNHDGVITRKEFAEAIRPDTVVVPEPLPGVHWSQVVQPSRQETAVGSVEVYKHEHECLVEVPEKHVHKVTNIVPKMEASLVHQTVEVREKHKLERLALEEKTVRENVAKEVHTSTIREAIEARITPVPQVLPDMTEYIPVRAPTVPPGELYTSKVEVTPRIHHVMKIDTRHDVLPAVEETCFVDVPQVVLVPQVEHQEFVTTIPVTHKEIYETIVPIQGPEEVRTRIQDIPQTHTTQKIHIMPKFVQPGDPEYENAITPAELARSYGLARGMDVVMPGNDGETQRERELHRLDTYKWHLAWQNRELEEKIAQYDQEIWGLDTRLKAEQSEVTELTFQLKAARDAIGVVRTEGRSPSPIRTGEYRSRRPASVSPRRAVQKGFL
jgi:hypothetical protein